MTRLTKSYSGMLQLPTFEERFEYLSLNGSVGAATFGSDRWLNQEFYRSWEWKRLREEIIVRDEARDLASFDHDIHDRAIIHHINPLTAEQIQDRSPLLLDPENLITTTHRTHNAIHYGDASLLPRVFVERRPGDTKSW